MDLDWKDHVHSFSYHNENSPVYYTKNDNKHIYISRLEIRALRAERSAKESVTKRPLADVRVYMTTLICYCHVLWVFDTTRVKIYGCIVLASENIPPEFTWVAPEIGMRPVAANDSQRQKENRHPSVSFSELNLSKTATSGWLGSSSIVAHINNVHLSAALEMMPDTVLRMPRCERCGIILSRRGCVACAGIGHFLLLPRWEACLLCGGRRIVAGHAEYTCHCPRARAPRTAGALMSRPHQNAGRLLRGPVQRHSGQALSAGQGCSPRTTDEEAPGGTNSSLSPFCTVFSGGVSESVRISGATQRLSFSGARNARQVFQVF